MNFLFGSRTNTLLSFFNISIYNSRYLSMKCVTLDIVKLNTYSLYICNRVFLVKQKLAPATLYSQLCVQRYNN